jgi:hypothetical protein
VSVEAVEGMSEYVSKSMEDGKEVCECRSCRGNVGVCVEVDGGWERGMWASRDVVEDERRRGEVMGVCEEGY